MTGPKKWAFLILLSLFVMHKIAYSDVRFYWRLLPMSYDYTQEDDGSFEEEVRQDAARLVAFCVTSADLRDESPVVGGRYERLHEGSCDAVLRYKLNYPFVADFIDDLFTILTNGEDNSGVLRTLGIDLGTVSEQSTLYEDVMNGLTDFGYLDDYPGAVRPMDLPGDSK